MELTAARPESKEHNELFLAYETVFNWVAGSPGVAFDFILEVLAMESNERVLGNLAAGPLEDLLGGHGEQLMPRIEAEARCNRRFSKLLGGVWKNDIDGPVWKKVLELRDLSGWDVE
jgi:hypothetical protein